MQEHVVQRIQSLGHRHCDNDAFSGCQTVRLDDNRNTIGFHVSNRCFIVLECLVGCSRDAVFFHQVFCELLGAFQVSRFFARSEDFQASRFKYIRYPFKQRDFRSDESPSDVVVFDELDQSLVVVFRNVY
ncbi:hypothetical protein SDC9_149767 [bioreactor metagenome]|uniref:Uncharacterized protein n=1 Tax=bioreactor metagenome TaxID=1076179 RepID=A0A645EKN8_9ZZZZ